MSHAAPAHHFGDKAGLLEHLQFLAWQEFADLLETASPDGLKAMGLRYVAHGIAHPRRMALMFNNPLVPWTEATKQQCMRAWQALYDAVARYVGPLHSAALDVLLAGLRAGN